MSKTLGLFYKIFVFLQNISTLKKSLFPLLRAEITGAPRPLRVKASTAQDAIAKIEKLSKLVTGGHVSIRNIFMAQAIKDNISDGAKIALVNTMACLDREREQVRFTEFKAAFRQTIR